MKSLAVDHVDGQQRINIRDLQIIVDIVRCLAVVPGKGSVDLKRDRRVVTVQATVVSTVNKGVGQVEVGVGSVAKGPILVDGKLSVAGSGDNLESLVTAGQTADGRKDD